VLKPLSILSDKMDSIKDTLKNCKSIKNSDEILDELFSSIKVSHNYSAIFRLSIYIICHFFRRRKGLRTKKVRTRKVKNPVKKRERGKNIRKVRRRKRNKRKRRRNISEEMSTVKNEKKNLPKRSRKKKIHSGEILNLMSLLRVR